MRSQYQEAAATTAADHWAAENLAARMDLAELVAGFRTSGLPEGTDAVLSAAVEALALLQTIAPEFTAELLRPCDAQLELVGRRLHQQVRRVLKLRLLDDLTQTSKEMKGKS